VITGFIFVLGIGIARTVKIIEIPEVAVSRSTSVFVNWKLGHRIGFSMLFGVRFATARVHC